MKKILTMLLCTLILTSGPVLAQQARTIQITVDGLVCAFCAQGIDKSLRRLEQTEDVYVSLERRLVAVATHPGTDIDDAVLTKTLKDAGYTVRAIERSAASLDDVREGGS
jgi:copper chaperone CopZ